MLAAVESIMQKQHTEGEAVFSLPCITLSPEKSFTYPPEPGSFSATSKKALVQEEKANISKSGGRFMYTCMCTVAFRTVWQDQWWGLKLEDQGQWLGCWSAIRKEHEAIKSPNWYLVIHLFPVQLLGATRSQYLKKQAPVLHLRQGNQYVQGRVKDSRQ